MSLIIPKGALFNITGGEWDESYDVGPYQALKMIDIEVCGDLFAAGDKKKDFSGFREWLVEQGYAEELDVYEWQIERHGKRDFYLSVPDEPFIIYDLKE